MMQSTIFELLEEKSGVENPCGEDLGPKSNYRSYTAYIKSYDWHKKRLRALKAAGHQCKRCEEKDTILEVHHKHYRTLFHERFQDVRVLCSKCHKEVHIAKEEEIQES